MRRAAVLLVLAACAEEPPPPAGATRPVVYATSYPLAYFARRIGGALVDVRFPAPAGEDPAFWRPDDDAVAAFQRADLILLNGAGHARWTEQASLPPSRCVDTSRGFRDRLLRMEGELTHSHGPQGAHEHGGWAFSTWLDPDLATLQARAALHALRGLLPGHEAALEDAFGALQRDLGELDARFREAAPREPVLASHPVYQYWARRYGVSLRSVHFEPGEVPDAAGWEELARLLAEQPVAWMLWEGEPAAETRTRLAELGVSCVVFDPCGNTPADGDFLSVMRANAARLAGAFPR